MKFETKYFENAESSDEVITFPNGLFGFEEEARVCPAIE